MSDEHNSLDKHDNSGSANADTHNYSNSMEGLLNIFAFNNESNYIILDKDFHQKPTGTSYSGTLRFPDFVQNLVELIDFWSNVKLNDDDLMLICYYINRNLTEMINKGIYDWKRIYEVTNNIPSNHNYTYDKNYKAELAKLEREHVLPNMADMRFIAKIYGLFYQFSNTPRFNDVDRDIILSLVFCLPATDEMFTIGELFDKYGLNEHDFVDVFHNEKFKPDTDNKILDSLNELKNYLYAREDAELQMENYLYNIAVHYNEMLQPRR